MLVYQSVKHNIQNILSLCWLTCHVFQPRWLDCPWPWCPGDRPRNPLLPHHVLYENCHENDGTAHFQTKPEYVYITYIYIITYSCRNCTLVDCTWLYTYIYILYYWYDSRDVVENRLVLFSEKHQMGQHLPNFKIRRVWALYCFKKNGAQEGRLGVLG